jgi:hypothetical protein
MKKIGCISQTYGNNRIQEIKCITFDDVGGALRDLLDEISFTFHNSSSEIVNEGRSILKQRFPTCNIRVINNVSYRDSIIQQLQSMKNNGLTDFALLQDDHHGINRPENIEIAKSIVEFYRSRSDIKFLHFYYKEGFPSENRVPKETVGFKGIKFHKYDSRDFKKDDMYSYNDGVFLMSIDMMLNIMSMPGIPEDVWGMEIWLKWLFDNNDIDRWGVSKEVFAGMYVHGRNTSKDSIEDQIRPLFGMKPNFDEFVKTLS